MHLYGLSVFAADGSRFKSISQEITFLTTPPTSVETEQLKNYDTMYIFAEKQGYRLSSNLDVDISEPGDWGHFRPYGMVDFPDYSTLSPDTISRFTRVDSYYVHFDNASYQNNSYNVENCVGENDVTAKIKFARATLGIIFRADDSYHLAMADDELGLSSVEYPAGTNNQAGAEVLTRCFSDRFHIAADRRTLRITLNNDMDADNFRIILKTK